MLDFLKELDRALKIVRGFAECGTFGQSSHIDADYKKYQSTFEPYANPWSIPTIDPSLYPNEGELIQAETELLYFLYGLVLSTKPRIVFESGTNIGLTTRILGHAALANGFGMVRSVEIDPRFVEVAKQVVGDQLPVSIICGNASEDEYYLCRADLAFIDSGYESRISEVLKLKRGAIFVVHDTHAEQWLRGRLMSVANPLNFSLIHVPGPRGFTIGKVE